MAKETVQAIRQAELNALQIEKDTNAKCEAILLKANEEAKDLIASKVKQALLVADQNKKQAQKEGEELVKAAVLRGEQEIMSLREMAKNKEQAAIDLILSEVI